MLINTNGQPKHSESGKKTKRLKETIQSHDQWKEMFKEISSQLKAILSDKTLNLKPAKKRICTPMRQLNIDHITSSIIAGKIQIITNTLI